jgi:plastocyanin
MRPRALLVVLSVLAALGAATGSGGGLKSADAAAAKPVTVRLGEFFFRPRVATVHVGQPVRFVNVGKIEHTVADTDAHGHIRSKLIHPRPLAHGQVQAVKFAGPGTVQYVCTFHPTLMRGRIVVVR